MLTPLVDGEHLGRHQWTASRRDRGHDHAYLQCCGPCRAGAAEIAMPRPRRSTVYSIHIKVLLTVSTPVSREFRHADLRSALFNAALDLLARNGSEALSLRAVARHAGVSAMAPYRHYADKAALLAALAAHGFDRLSEVLGQADAGAVPGQALVAQAVAYVRFALANPALFRLMFMVKQMEHHGELVEAGQRAFGVLSARVASDTASTGDRQALALGAWAFVHGLAVLFLDGLVGERMAGSDVEVTRRVTEAMLGRPSRH